MAEDRFDLFLTGQLAMGCDRGRAIAQLAKLFKRPPEQIKKLLVGKPTRVRKAISGEEISRLQLAFDKLGILTESQPAISASPQAAAIERHAAAAPPEALSLSPVGSPVLRENERKTVAPPVVNTSHLSVSSGDPVSTPARASAPPPPDVSHLQLLQPGTAPGGHSGGPVQIDLDELCGGISLAPAGSQLGVEREERFPPPPDTSHLRCH